MPMEQLGLQLYGLRKHCHNSVNRKASKCNSAALPELYFFFRSAPGFQFGRSVVPTSLRGNRRMFCNCNKVNENLPRISLDPGNSHAGPLCAL